MIRTLPNGKLELVRDDAQGLNDAGADLHRVVELANADGIDGLRLTNAVAAYLVTLIRKGEIGLPTMIAAVADGLAVLAQSLGSTPGIASTTAIGCAFVTDSLAAAMADGLALRELTKIAAEFRTLDRAAWIALGDQAAAINGSRCAIGCASCETRVRRAQGEEGVHVQRAAVMTGLLGGGIKKPGGSCN